MQTFILIVGFETLHGGNLDPLHMMIQTQNSALIEVNEWLSLAGGWRSA